MDTTADKIEIQELVARYGLAWDTMDVDGVTSCFTEDGVFVDAAGEAHRGRAEIAAFVRASEAQFGRMRHITSSHLVELEPEGRAHHRCYVVFVSHPAEERRLDTGGYDDRLVREDGGWRFVERVVRFD